MNHVSNLQGIQQDIQRAKDEHKELVSKRSQIILEARKSGMTNREIALALDVHESHVYRMIEK